MKLYTEQDLLRICTQVAKRASVGSRTPMLSEETIKGIISDNKTKLVAEEQSRAGSLDKFMKDENIQEIPMKIGIKGHELLEITSEELKTKYEHSLTVGALKQFIEKYNIPDSAKVLTERVEDFYYENNHWSVLRHGGYWYHSQKRMNEKVDSGEFNDKTRYPKMDDPQKYKVSEEVLHEMKSQYTPAHCCTLSEEFPEVLFINLHY